MPTGLLRALAVNFVWINLSEVVRYFALVMPMMREAFPQIPDVAPMSLPVFLVWGLWDLILIGAVTGFCWLFVERFGASWANGVLAGSCAWAGIFGILWLGLWNMNLATPAILVTALPLAWIELAVAGLIVVWAMRARLPAR